MYIGQNYSNEEVVSALGHLPAERAYALIDVAESIYEIRYLEIYPHPVDDEMVLDPVIMMLRAFIAELGPRSKHGKYASEILEKVEECLDKIRQDQEYQAEQIEKLKNIMEGWKC